MKHWNHSIRFLFVMTLLTGFIYPGLITIVGKVLFSNQASGSLVINDHGQIVGSKLIAQDFKSEKYFYPRPSAVDYNPMSSGATNLGPTSKDLLVKVEERKAKGAKEDLLFASGSGLDPEISPTGAFSQVARVAQARGVSEKEIRDIVASTIDHRQFGFLGEKRVNVLMLNLKLDQQFQ